MISIPPSSTINQTPSKRDFLEVKFEEIGKVGDLFYTTDDTISINPSGRKILREKFATEEFIPNQVAWIHALEDWTFLISFYVWSIHAAISTEGDLFKHLRTEKIITTSAIPRERLSALSELLVPDKFMKVLATIKYLKQYFDIPASQSMEKIEDSRRVTNQLLNTEVTSL